MHGLFLFNLGGLCAITTRNQRYIRLYTVKDTFVIIQYTTAALCI